MLLFGFLNSRSAVTFGFPEWFCACPSSVGSVAWLNSSYWNLFHPAKSGFISLLRLTHTWSKRSFSEFRGVWVFNSLYIIVHAARTWKCFTSSSCWCVKSSSSAWICSSEWKADTLGNKYFFCPVCPPSSACLRICWRRSEFMLRSSSIEEKTSIWSWP